MNILLICGHGDGDPGACAFNYQEAVIVREIAPKIKDILSSYADVTLFDVNKDMYKHLESGNSFNFKAYDYVVELHLNSCVKDVTGNGVTTGTEILVHPSERGISVEEEILKNICALGFRNRGIKQPTNLYNMNVCKGKQGVSYALIEICFIDDLDDMRLFNQKKGAIINAIAQGIITGFGLPEKTNEEKLLTSANDIAWELNHSYFPITEMTNFIKVLDEAKKANSPLYWGYYKLVNKIK